MNIDKMPLFSVLIVTYNCERFILDTLDSVCNQGFENYEIILLDDCSDDNTWSLSRSYKSKKLQCYRNDENLGEYKNRDKALNIAKGEYVIYIDGEDLLYPNALNILAHYVTKYSDVGQFLAVEWNEKIILPVLLNSSMFHHIEYLDDGGFTALNFTRIVFNRKALLSLGGFSFDGIKCGDYYIQLLLSNVYNTVLIPAGFSWWRRRNGQASDDLLKNNYNYFNELLKFKPNLIKKSKQLSISQKKIALNNFYGIIWRFLAREILKVRFIKILKFIIKNQDTTKYFNSILRKRKKSILIKFNGEEPLKD